MSAYIAPGLIPEVRRVIISDKIISEMVDNRKPTRSYKRLLNMPKDRKEYAVAYRIENATKMGERTKLGMRKLRAKIKLGI